MRSTARRITALILGATLVTGVAGCGYLPDIDPSNLPSITRVPDNSSSPEPAPTETVTEDPEPVPTETETIAPEPDPEPTPTPTATETASSNDVADGSGDELWPWAIAALILAAIAIIWGVWHSKRSGWDKQLMEARAEIAWFEDSLIPQILAKPSQTEAMSMWQAGRTRVIDTDQALHELTESAPSDERRHRAAQGQQVLRLLAEAIDADTSSAAGTDADSLRARRASLDTARAQARDWLSATQ
ncbi:hypothetical protein [Demequina flava]|uniref:hypothetical protein n=1 Tax=Demequina flava TaxID=1095025 RepID=UPI000782E366|nr:hypothetical protein [Demequina flava]